MTAIRIPKIERSSLPHKFERSNKMVERSEYNGKPVLILRRSEEDKFPFSFGLVKAKMVLENIEEIKKFVADNSDK